MKIVKKVKNLSNMKKTAIALVTILAVGGAGATAYASNQSKQKMIEAQAMITTKTNDLKELENDINQLFDPVENNFLKRNITEDQVKEVSKKLNAILNDKYDERLYLSDYNEESANAKKAMNKLEATFKIQTAINKLYKNDKNTVAINGSEVKKDLAIADDLKVDSVEEVKGAVGLSGGSVQEEHTTFDEVAIDLVKNAENQLKQIDTATQAVKKVYEGNKVVSTDSKLYDSAKTETDKIKNAKAKKDLSDQLEKVKKDIDKKVEEPKKQEEQKQAPEGTETVQAGTTQDQTQTAQNNATSPDYSGTTNGATDNGNYVPQDVGGDYQQPQNQAPQPTAPPANDGATGGGQTTAPPATGGGNNVVVNPGDIQGSEENNTGGTNEWWGWD